MSRTQCENIFSQAVFAPLVWHKAMQVMELFEDGKLKSQKFSKKNLISKPEFKQHHFQCLHNLAPLFQEVILQKVIECKITSEEMKKDQTGFKHWRMSRRCLPELPPQIRHGKRQWLDFRGTQIRRT